VTSNQGGRMSQLDIGDGSGHYTTMEGDKEHMSDK